MPRFFIDCIVLEATELTLLPPKTSSGWNLNSWNYLWTPTQITSAFCTVQSDHQKYSTTALTEVNPVWHSSLTFTFPKNSKSHLRFSVFTPTTAWTPDQLIGTSTVANLQELEPGEIIDQWVDLFSSDIKTGRIHLILQKILQTKKKSLLSHLGMPLSCVPLRVNYGDIILFNNPEIMRLPIKLATASEWDHIGMIVKFPKKSKKKNNKNKNEDSTTPKKKPKKKFGFYLLEAVNEGVKIFNCDARLKFYLETAKLGVRRLNIERNQKIYKQLSSFVNEAVGMPYTPLMDIVNLYFDSGAEMSTNAHVDLKKKQTKNCYFCSELVAEAYQEMGILERHIGSEKYFPIDFSLDEIAVLGTEIRTVKLKLENGKLGEILVVPPTGVVHQTK